MNNEGFTLVELIGIILILAIIFLVSYPNFANIYENNKNVEYDELVNTLCLAGKTYIYDNMEDYANLNTSGSSISINISDLIDEGLVEEDTINSKTNNNLENDKLIFIVQSDKSLDCKYIEG